MKKKEVGILTLKEGDYYFVHEDDGIPSVVVAIIKTEEDHVLIMKWAEGKCTHYDYLDLSREDVVNYNTPVFVETEGIVSDYNPGEIFQCRAFPLHPDLDSLSLKDDAQFFSLMNRAIETCGLQENDIVKDLTVTKSTVNRWVNGKTTPHPALRVKIYEYLKEKEHRVVEMVAKGKTSAFIRVINGSGCLETTVPLDLKTKPHKDNA